MTEFRLPQKTLLLWQLRALVIGIILSALCIYLGATFSLLKYLPVVLAAIFAAAIFWYLPKLFKSCKIKLSSDGIIIMRGVIVKNTHILPFSRLIYTQTLVTPLARLFGLTALTLKAARSRLFVPELSNGDVEALLNKLLKGEAE